LVHGDLHPENVILTADGPMVIDWRNAEEGPAEFDLAMSAVILAQALLDPTYAEVAGLIRGTLESFLAAAPDPSAQLRAALERRAADPAISEAERPRLTVAADLIRANLP